MKEERYIIDRETDYEYLQTSSTYSPFLHSTCIMAWGSPKQPPPPKSSFAYAFPPPLRWPQLTPSSKLLPLIIFLIVVAGAAFVGYHIYLSVLSITDAANKRMEAKDVVITKDGVKVGVKQVSTDDYVDKHQSLLVKAWNLSSWPAYKSRLWAKEKEEGKTS